MRRNSSALFALTFLPSVLLAQTPQAPLSPVPRVSSGIGFDFSIKNIIAATTTIETLRDSAWVGGPCSSCAGFYPDGKRLWFVSESTGFAQLYSASVDGGNVSALTRGNWEVMSVAVSPDKRDLYLTTSEPSPMCTRRRISRPTSSCSRTLPVHHLLGSPRHRAPSG